MTALRPLAESITAFRIDDPNGEYPIWSDGGARTCSGRWHEAGASVIYASEHHSTAMLEKLVHYDGEMPPNQHFLEIAIPAGTSYEVANVDLIPRWADPCGGNHPEIRAGLVSGGAFRDSDRSVCRCTEGAQHRFQCGAPRCFTNQDRSRDADLVG